MNLIEAAEGLTAYYDALDMVDMETRYRLLIVAHQRLMVSQIRVMRMLT